MRIMKDASDHPNDALANAAGLARPWRLSHTWKLHARIQKRTARWQESHWAKALELLPKIPLREQMPVITEMTSLYEQLGDKESAEKTIELGTKIAARYSRRRRMRLIRIWLRRLIGSRRMRGEIWWMRATS